jgi:hypothetical protein
MILSTLKAKRRIVEIRYDPLGIGRWIWVRYSSQQNVSLRVISVYLCSNGTCPRLVYHQQKRYLGSIRDSRSPALVMLEDLKSNIS